MNAAVAHLSSRAVKSPVLRWHGSKWRIADWVLGHFPAHFTYVEPFGGSAAVLLKKPRSGAEVYNDLDGNLVNLFTVLRDDAESLRRAMALTPMSRDEYLGCWAKLQAPVGLSPLERARCLLVCAFQARGSIVGRTTPTGWRIFAKETDFSQTPADQWAGLEARIRDVTDRLQGVYIENRDALTLIGEHDSKETLFYLDPPYAEEARTEKLGNYRHEMADDAHEALLAAIQKVKGYVVLSGYDSPLYRERLKGWHFVACETRAESNAERVECLWLSPRTYEALNRKTGRTADLFGAAA